MPQPQGIPPDDAIERLVAATDALAAALAEREAAVVDALKRGGSVRQVSAISGLSDKTVQRIGHANGWPTAAQRKKWADEKAARDAFKERFQPRPHA